MISFILIFFTLSSNYNILNISNNNNDYLIQSVYSMNNNYHLTSKSLNHKINEITPKTSKTLSKSHSLDELNKSINFNQLTLTDTNLIENSKSSGDISSIDSNIKSYSDIHSNSNNDVSPQPIHSNSLTQQIKFWSTLTRKQQLYYDYYMSKYPHLAKLINSLSNLLISYTNDNNKFNLLSSSSSLVKFNNLS